MVNHTNHPTKWAHLYGAWDQAYRNGKSIEEIARSSGANASTVSRMIKKHFGTPVDPNPRLRVDIKDDHLCQLYGQGLNLSQIGRQVGLSYQTIGLRLRKNGIVPERHPWRKPESMKKAMVEDYVVRGLPSTAIAAKYGVCYGTVLDAVEAAGEQIREFSPQSFAEKEIRQLLLDHEVKLSNRRKVLEGGREVDIITADHHLGIEFCGLYWHMEPNRGKRDHYEKWKECSEKGMTLLTIFEDEWANRKEIVCSVILAKLGIFARRLYARQCEAKPITRVKAREFYENNHIQGGKGSYPHSIGLYHKDELVMVMSFGPHPRSCDVLVLNRLCSKMGVQVVGGAQRCLKKLLESTAATKIISWSDNRWSDGGIYRTLGFHLAQDLGPDYSYTNRKTRRSKQSMKKSTVKCPKEIKEKDWALEHGWHRIWDCGKKRWELTC